MSLPNYAPSGTILFGSVPWDSGYNNVRLYSSLDEQYTDIAQMMKIRSNNYSYIGRNRRLKVNIPADRLYHCNYCMYRNESLTDGYIYCFVSDVKYINDNTSEIALDTDIFQTYLYNVDWTIPACFIERETTPDESEKYMLTNEPDFPLIQVVDEQHDHTWNIAGFVIMTCAEPQKNDNLIEDIINPQGYYADPAPIQVFKGVPNGCAFYYCPIDTTSGNSDSLQTFLNELTFAGSIDSVVGIFSIPDFSRGMFTSDGFQPSASHPDSFGDYQQSYTVPERGTTVDGYSPRNKKLLYYPYTYCNLTDMNGSSSQLRYELMGSQNIYVKYAPTGACQAIVFPAQYRGIVYDLESGIVVSCGSQGSWSNNTYTTWLAQNSGTIALAIAGTALTGLGGAATIAGASAALASSAVKVASGAMANTAADITKFVGSTLAGGAMLGNAANQGANQAATMVDASKQPTVTRGQTNYNLQSMTGVQGFYLQKICVKAEVAEQIDEFFDRWGYEVDRIEAVNITSRPAWNYVKTQGASPKSLNAGAGAAAPFTRGRGTPAEALDLIRRAFDGGITFWHTTGNYGDYSQANGV